MSPMPATPPERPELPFTAIEASLPDVPCAVGVEPDCRYTIWLPTQPPAQASKVCPFGHDCTFTQVLDVEQSAVPEGQPHAPHWLVYCPPIGLAHAWPAVEVAA